MFLVNFVVIKNMIKRLVKTLFVFILCSENLVPKTLFLFLRNTFIFGAKTLFFVSLNTIFLGR